MLAVLAVLGVLVVLVARTHTPARVSARIPVGLQGDLFVGNSPEVVGRARVPTVRSRFRPD